MAKRGYRGKHPHDDMKVSKHSVPGASSKAHPKLTEQYNNLKPKQRYSFIRDHEGFFPQGTMTISSSKDFVAASEITMSGFTNQNTKLELRLKGRAGTTQTGNKLFQTNTNAKAASEGIRDNVNTHLAGAISASATKVDGSACSTTDCVVNLTSHIPGPDGNYGVTLGAVNVISTVTFNGVSAKESGSSTTPIVFTGG